jgi:hypothetical protein
MKQKSMEEYIRQYVEKMRSMYSERGVEWIPQRPETISDNGCNQ